MEVTAWLVGAERQVSEFESFGVDSAGGESYVFEGSGNQLHHGPGAAKHNLRLFCDRRGELF